MRNNIQFKTYQTISISKEVVNCIIWPTSKLLNTISKQVSLSRLIALTLTQGTIDYHLTAFRCLQLCF
jgi:hypothetical protein